MKKILTLLAIALAALTSCNEKEKEKVEQEYIWLDIQQGDDGWWYESIEAFGDTENSISIVAYGEGSEGYAESIQEESDWTVSCDADWCHFEYELKETYEASYNTLILDIICEDNTTGEDRVAIITVSVKDATYEIEIRQLGVPSVTVSTPGTLTQELADKDLLYAISLKISGELNAKDLETIKGLRDVEILDLTDAVIDDLPDEMFRMNETIKRVKLPETIKVIHPRTFAFSSLEYIYFPAGIEMIEDGEMFTHEYFWYYSGAFANTNLTTIEFAPNSKLNYIGALAFAGAGRYELGEDRYILEIILPESVETIADGAFSYNARGKLGDASEFRIPDVDVYFETGSKLKFFGRTYLLNSSLTINAENADMVERVGLLHADYVDMTIGTQIPPMSDGVSSSYSHLYVPKGCVGAYYEADGWKDFQIIKEIGQE